MLLQTVNKQSLRAWERGPEEGDHGYQFIEISPEERNVLGCLKDTHHRWIVTVCYDVPTTFGLQLSVFKEHYFVTVLLLLH